VRRLKRPAHAIHRASEYQRVLHFPIQRSLQALSPLTRSALRLWLWQGRRRRRRRRYHLRRRNRRDRVLEDQLLLIVCFKDHGVLVEAFDFSYQFYTADQENRDRCLISPDGVEVDVLNV